MKKGICTWMAAAVCVAAVLTVGAAERADSGSSVPPKGEREALPPPPGPSLPESGRKFRSGPGIWQVFSQLSPEERREMQKLQREEPAKFREVMQAKAEALFRRRQARMAELRALAKQCRESADAGTREKLRARLTAEVEKDFREHLAANRRQLEEMKRQSARMEQKLQRREAGCSKAVAAMVEAMIRGEKPSPPRQNRISSKEKLEK